MFFVRQAFIAVVTVLTVNAAITGVNDKDETYACIVDGDNGTCGENLTWEYYNGTLTINGTGMMRDYEYDDEAPWYYCSEIESVVIEKGVTSIGNEAFSVLYNLKNLSIPDSVTSIGNRAFSGCGSLHEFTIPVGITKIGRMAFEYCYNLQNITIPENIDSIGSGAFGSCDSLTHIFVDDKNKKFKSIDGILFNYEGNTIVQYPSGLSNTNYTIPDTVTYVGDGAFYGSKLENITIPSTVISLGKDAFSDSSLSGITLPDSITSIGENAFSWCRSLKSIIIPNGIKTIANDTFQSCSNLVDVFIPDSVMSIGSGAFSYCSSLTSIDIPATVGWIGSFAFSCCDALTHIRIPETVTSIESYTFHSCESLSNFMIPKSIELIGDSAFSDCTSLKSVTIPESVTVIGDYAFSQCKNLESISFSEGVRSIGKGAFCECGLINVTIPDSVVSLGAYAFYRCTSLLTVFIPESVTAFQSYIFDGCSNLNTIFYQGSAYVETRLFSSINNLINVKNVCVSPDYNFTTFGGANVTSSDVCQEFQETFNHCFKASYVNGTFVKDGMKNSAIEWEKQSSECVLFQCMNESGLTAWSLCNSTDELNRFCINDRCVESKESAEKRVRVEIDIEEGVKVTDISREQILETIRVHFGLDTNDVMIGYENDEYGIVLRVFVFVDDEKIASIIVDSLKHVEKGEGCQFDVVLCRTKAVRLTVEIEHSLSDVPSLHQSLETIILLFFVFLLQLQQLDK